MAGQQSRPPDYNISALDKNTQRRGPIGVGWLNDDGTITLRFNFLTMIDTAKHDLVITAFPNVGARYAKKRTAATPDRWPVAPLEGDEDTVGSNSADGEGIPF